MIMKDLQSSMNIKTLSARMCIHYNDADYKRG